MLHTDVALLLIQVSQQLPRAASPYTAKGREAAPGELRRGHSTAKPRAKYGPAPMGHGAAPGAEGGCRRSAALGWCGLGEQGLLSPKKRQPCLASLHAHTALFSSSYSGAIAADSVTAHNTESVRLKLYFGWAGLVLINLDKQMSLCICVVQRDQPCSPSRAKKCSQLQLQDPM